MLPPPLRSAAAALALVAAAAAACGCASPRAGQAVRAIPVVEGERPTPASPWTWDIAWPFLHGEEGPASRTAGLRPLLRSVETDDGSRLEVLYPFFRDVRDGGDRSVRLFPFLWHDSMGEGEDRDVDTAVAPFLWWGREPGEGAYFLLFPVGGTVREKFLLDEGTFVLFPAYLRTRNGEYRGTHLLWPLVHSGSGDGRSAFRVLPFWSQADAEGRYRRRALLWPILHWGDEDLGGEDPRSRWLVWPLVGREASRSGAYRAWTALWPFLQWSDGPRSTARDLPFPFFRTRVVRDADGAVESSLLWLWPLWGRADGPEGGSGFLLWPVGMSFHDARTSATYVNPFWFRIERAERDGAPAETAWRLWPLAGGVARGDGSAEWSALAPIPFVRWPEFDANWGVFWELLRRRRDADGSTATDALFSLVRHRSGPDGWRFRVPGVVALEGAREGGTSWRALEGLVGVEGAARGGSALRLLWFLRIPLSAGGVP